MLAPTATGSPLTVTDPVSARLVSGAVHSCDQILAAHSPPVAKLSCLRQALYEQLSMDLTGPGWPADVLGFLLRNRPGPFTWVLGRLTGDTPRVDPSEPRDGTERRATGAEAADLGVTDTAGLWIWERAGLLILGGTVAAEVTLRLLPSRVGDERLARIAKGEPAGQVIPHLVRAARTGRVRWPREPAVEGGAVLQDVAGRPFGFAAEQVTPALIARLACPG